MSTVKSSQDLALIRVAGQKLGRILSVASMKAVIGMTTSDLDDIISDLITTEDCTASFLGYDGFPRSSCLSINQQVVHGIPGTRMLADGDVLGIDVGLWYKGICVDGAVTIIIGQGSEEAERLLECTKQALFAGIRAIKPFRRVGSISQAIQQVAEENGLGIVRALTGHGVGHHVHEPPEVPNLGRIGDGALLKPGMVLAIEPMFTLGSGDVLTEVDGWGIVTADGSLAAQFEHTVIITARGAEIVTLPV